MIHEQQPRPSFQGAIFDFNGVIIDDYALQKAAWNQLSLMIRHRPLTDDEMRRQVLGLPTREIIAWLAGPKVSEADVQAFAAQKRTILNQLFATSPLFRLNAGLESFLDELQRQRIPHTIATSQAQDTFYDLFDRLGLAKWFDRAQAVYYDGTYPGKPAPDMYQRAAHSLDLDPSQCVVFEDALSGIEAAQAAGSGAIVAVGHQAEAFRSMPGVIKTIPDFSGFGLADLSRVA